MSLIVIDTEDKIDAFLEDNVEIINIDLTLSAQTSSKINRYLVDATHSTDKDEFDKKYLNLIASLGRSYNSKYWWANSISEKNEISSQFYQRLFYLHRIAQHLDQPNLTRMLVLSSDKEFIHYLQNINFPCDNIEAPSTKHFVFKKNARNLVRLLCKVLLIFLREISRLCLSRRYLSKTILKIKKSKRLLIIKTIIDRRNYKSGRYVDSYYGRLLEYLKKKDVPFVLVGELVQDYSKNLKKIAREGAYSLITTETFMGLRDLIATFYESFVKRLKFKEKVFLGEMDISELVRAEFKECFYGAKFLENLLCHRKVLKLAENLDIKKYLYTFEGYAWERMSIMGLKSHKNDIEIIGFQHAFVSKNSFRYFPGERERDILPLPDKIVTMGQITKEILQRFGHYPNLNIVEGCALRQERTLQLDKIPRGEKKNIFIPLTIAVDDTVRVINFIYEAGLGSYPYKIFLRFHPLTPRKKVIAQLKNPLPENFIISDTAFLADEFQRCGVVLYTWTTVCLEAVLVGLPVIYLDINAPLNVDPLFDLSHLKESVGSPGELLDKINGLLNLNQSNFEKLYHDSREYIRRYLYPVTDSAMNCFY